MLFLSFQTCFEIWFFELLSIKRLKTLLIFCDTKHIYDKINSLISTVDKNEEWETETMDNFYNDVSSLLEKKGEAVMKKSSSYTLFDDATSD